MNEKVFLFFNSIIGQSEFLDKFLSVIVSNHLVKGGAMMAVFWMIWGLTDPNNKPLRARLIALVFVTPVVVVIARFLVFLFPFQTRPVHTPGLDMKMVSPDFGGWLNDFSSFPSDHAVLFFGVATALFMVQRLLGIAAFFYAGIVICLPRVILGLHWPADIAVGASVGIALNLALIPLASRLILYFDWSDARPSVAAFVYPLMFLITFQIATLFEATRSLAESMARFAFGG